MQQLRVRAVARTILTPFPKLATFLYNMATKADQYQGTLHFSNDPGLIDTLPASARRIYSTLRSMILEIEIRNRNQ
jgi:hypothetical protein